MDNIEEELAAFDSDAQETQLMESTGAALDDEMDELSPITKIGWDGGEMLFHAEEPLAVGVENNEEEVESDGEPSTSGNSALTNRPRRNTAPSPTNETARKKRRPTSTSRMNSNLTKNRTSSNRKSQKTRADAVGTLLSDGTVLVNGVNHQVVMPVIMTHAGFIYRSNMSRDTPTLRQTAVKNREASFTPAALAQCISLFGNSSVPPPPE